MPTNNKFADRIPAPPVNGTGVGPEPTVVVLLLDVLLLGVSLVDVELTAAHDVKVWLPRKTPTVWTSVKCSTWRMAAAVETFVAQKSAV